ncbi:flagellar hook-length control protein FliK [Vibrio owensii]|uniref:flagellar hook-length control protein FliK n=1 Tax=Vibrio owensii TaxID=696485 RepID=UPI0018F1D702|nr:flagellar hook-length control protein FliK [Vibrio owensii]
MHPLLMNGNFSVPAVEPEKISASTLGVSEEGAFSESLTRFSSGQGLFGQVEPQAVESIVSIELVGELTTEQLMTAREDLADIVSNLSQDQSAFIESGLERVGLTLAQFEGVVEASNNGQDLLENLAQLLGSDFQIGDYVSESGELAWLDMIEQLILSQSTSAHQNVVVNSPTQTLSFGAERGVSSVNALGDKLNRVRSFPQPPSPSPSSLPLVPVQVVDRAGMSILAQQTAVQSLLSMAKGSSENLLVDGQQGAQVSVPKNLSFTAQLTNVDLVSREAIASRLSEVLGDKLGVQIASKANDSTATIRLDPPHLGKVSIKLQVEGDRVVVQVAATNNITRDALKETTDALRDGLSGQFSAVDVEVSDQSQDLYSDADDAQEILIASNSLTIGEDEAGVEQLDDGVLHKV